MALNTVVSTFKGVDSPRAISYYNLSALSIIITYSIVIRQTYKSKPITFLFSQLPSLLKDDNVQYLLLAIVYRLFSSRFYGGISSFTLYPFGIFAVFHALTYFETNILRFVPGVTYAKQHQISGTIAKFIKDYNERSLFVAANFEVLSIATFIWPVIKMILTFRLIRPSYFFQNIKTISLFVSLVVFNKLRFNQNKYTQALIGSYDMRLNQYIYNSPLIPASLKQSVTRARAAAIYYLSFIKVPSAPVQKKRS
ncbi:unnamed protein product [Ambrosiozyma monospora]|uniref:Unnamed protein product n=1 Tax=Ambrosiozyma monospora TaxID=43982 RepID=A0ACB5U351_AMBMO|nr:unnamed protein product [Ambrosiozyma monospora]